LQRQSGRPDVHLIPLDTICCDATVVADIALDWTGMGVVSGSISSYGTVFVAPSSNSTRAEVGPADTTVAAYFRPSPQGTTHFEPLVNRGDDGVGGGGGGTSIFGGGRLPVTCS